MRFWLFCFVVFSSSLHKWREKLTRVLQEHFQRSGFVIQRVWPLAICFPLSHPWFSYKVSLILVCRPIRLFWRLNDLPQLEEWLVLRSLNKCQLSLLVGAVCVDIIIKEGLSEMIIGHLLGGLLYNPRFFTRACLVTQLCPALCDLVDCSPPGFSVHRIFQARILERVAISSCRGSSWLRDQTWVSHASCIRRHIL